jgi:hypothetical protein
MTSLCSLENANVLQPPSDQNKKSLSVFPQKEIHNNQDQFDLTLNLHLGGKLSRKRHQLS